jgi:outer membrane protein
MDCTWLILLLATNAGTATRTLSLEEAVELALGSDPELGAARAVRERTELAVLRAQLDRFSFAIDAQLEELWAATNIGGDPLPPGTLTDGGFGLSSATANLTVPIFSGLRVEKTVGRAKDLDEAAMQDVLQQRKGVALSVARAYWAIRKLDLLRAVQARALERLRNAEEIASSRVGAGLAPPIDTNRAASRRMLQEATLLDLQGQHEQATEQLAVALGLAGPIVLSDEPHLREALPGPVEALLEDAKNGRPELHAAQLRLRAQDQAIDIALAGYYPQLSAFSVFQYGNNPLVPGTDMNMPISSNPNPFSNAAGNFQVGAILSINLFDTLLTYTEVKDARYEAQRLAEEMRRVGRVVEADVRAARAKVIRFHQVRRRLRSAEEVARDNLAINQKRYENGEALVFELLDSEIELLDVERRLADAESELVLSWLELDASLGAVVGVKQ